MCGCRNERARMTQCRRWQEERRGYVSMDVYNARADSDGCGCNCHCCSCCGN
ncbi:MAG: hypothetical protein SPL89_01345 [Clostridia bacterium]|nr:hypothetical protein [Clostridia bacterium]